MKITKLESKKIAKAANSRRVAGVQVRSGVKAGIGFAPTGIPGDDQLGGFGGGRGGGGTC